MAEYIEREAVKDAIGFIKLHFSGVGEKSLLDIINEVPAADVVERKRGEWKYIGGDEWCCSCCGFVASTEGRWEPMMTNFCEECGADMREGSNHADNHD